MKLLFITMTPLFHNTSAIIRTCGYISGANKNGHICDVITLEASSNDYLYDPSNQEFVKKHVRNYFVFRKNAAYDVVKSKAGEKKTSLIKTVGKNILRTTFDFFSIYDAQYINARGVLGIDIDYDSYDRIISISDPISSYTIVFELIKNNRLHNIDSKWIQCWGDPWISDITKNIGIKKHLVKREEEHILGWALKIIYASPFTLSVQQKLYPQYAHKMICLNQVAQSMVTSKDSTQEHLIGYFGNYDSRVRNIKPLYNCCKKNRFSLVIAGGTDLQLDHTDHISVEGMQKYNKVKEMETNTGILVAICNLRGNQIPGKVFYQAGLNKPIIIILDGELKSDMEDYFRSFNRYILCENNEDSIREGIETAMNEIGKNYADSLDERLKDTFCAKKMLED